jgi:predicted ArsR family transcriptional regulator
MDELADLGFDPALDRPDDGEQAIISFLRCPFREVAVLYPDVVCQLHRGITEGILAGATGACPGLVGRVESFTSLVDADPCRVELSLRS